MMGAKLSAADLERIASAYSEPPVVADLPSKQLGRGRRSENCVSPLPLWEAIYAGCDALRAWADTPDGLPEPQWYAMASVVARCRNGRAIFHALSANDHRYNCSETESKLDQAINASGPRLCSSIQDLGGNCADCVFAGRLNSPISLGYVDDPAIVELARRWVYVAAQDCFLPLPKEAQR